MPYFPEEDSKLRATSCSRRRGGNTSNSFEVITQLFDLVTNEISEPVLIAVLPSPSSPSIPFIRQSLANSSGSTRVDLRHCIYRETHIDPVSSFIISSEAAGTRTIVNHNELPEMTVEEFNAIVAMLVQSAVEDGQDQIWFHFEGRIPQTTLTCIRGLRQRLTRTNPKPQLRISVEIEKPGREGLQDLVYEADVVFYSKGWAEAEGHLSAMACLESQVKVIADAGCTGPGKHDDEFERTLVCTWGDKGAAALKYTCQQGKTAYGSVDIASSTAFVAPNQCVVDTIGAGDTFIAGILFGFMHPWSLQQKLAFATELAGWKVVQVGFDGLGRRMRSTFQNYKG